MKKPNFDGIKWSVHTIMDRLSNYAERLELTKGEQEDIRRLISVYEGVGLALKRYFDGITVRGGDTKDDEIYRA